jgi:glycosyltransferase involved in cell wall biosynthesis
VFQPDHRWVRKLSVPYVLTPHGGYNPQAMSGLKGAIKRLIFRAQEAAILRGAVAIQALTVAEQQDLARLIPGARTVILPFPTKPLPITPQSYADCGPIIFVGRLDTYVKGLDLLLGAVAQGGALVRKRGLVLVGPRQGTSDQKLDELVRLLGLTGSVSVESPIRGRTELARKLQSASIFVHTSRREGLPGAVLEAMECAIPVLVTHATNVGTLVCDTKSGIVVEGDVDSIQRGLVTLLELPAEERAAMGRRGREAVLSHFSWEGLARQYVELYRPASNQ